MTAPANTAPRPEDGPSPDQLQWIHLGALEQSGMQPSVETFQEGFNWLMSQQYEGRTHDGRFVSLAPDQALGIVPLHRAIDTAFPVRIRTQGGETFTASTGELGHRFEALAGRWALTPRNILNLRQVEDAQSLRDLPFAEQEVIARLPLPQGFNQQHLLNQIRARAGSRLDLNEAIQNAMQPWIVQSLEGASDDERRSRALLDAHTLHMARHATTARGTQGLETIKYPGDSTRPDMAILQNRQDVDDEFQKFYFWAPQASAEDNQYVAQAKELWQLLEGNWPYATSRDQAGGELFVRVAGTRPVAVWDRARQRHVEPTGLRGELRRLQGVSQAGYTGKQLKRDFTTGVDTDPKAKGWQPSGPFLHGPRANEYRNKYETAIDAGRQSDRDIPGLTQEIHARQAELARLLYRGGQENLSRQLLEGLVLANGASPIEFLPPRPPVAPTVGRAAVVLSEAPPTVRPPEEPEENNPFYYGPIIDYNDGAYDTGDGSESDLQEGPDQEEYVWPDPLTSYDLRRRSLQRALSQTREPRQPIDNEEARSQRRARALGENEDDRKARRSLRLRLQNEARQAPRRTNRRRRTQS